MTRQTTRFKFRSYSKSPNRILGFFLHTTMHLFTKLKPSIAAIRRFTSSINPKTLAEPKIQLHKSGRIITRVSIYSISSGRMWLGGQRRFYFVDRYGVQHFKSAKGYKELLETYRNKLICVTLGGLGCGAYIYSNRESVPYTSRKHFVLLSIEFERWLGQLVFEDDKVSKKTLPAKHPYSVKVKSITENIINAMYRDLNASRGVMGETVVKGDEVMSVCRFKDETKGSKSGKKHLEGINWEVIVVNEPRKRAYCAPGGKIVVFTGLLKHFEKDAEIATIIGHEVAHALARHTAENITRVLVLDSVIKSFILNWNFLADKLYSVLIKLPYSRRKELEADSIGLLLMALAGYDPRVAPEVYAKLSWESTIIEDYTSTHPSGKERVRLLAEGSVMNKAMSIYDEVAAKLNESKSLPIENTEASQFRTF